MEMKISTTVKLGAILIMLFLASLTTASANTEVTKEIDIMTTPENVFFDLKNIKPGDWSTKTLLITNSGKEDFHYTASSMRKVGSKELYEALLLTIKDSNGEIYNGTLGDFDKLESRFIASNDSEELEFTIKFPEELGNEYQGLHTEVEFKFYAEGTLGGLLPVDGPKLPDTATGYYTLVATGIFFLGGGSLLLLVRNRLRKAKG